MSHQKERGARSPEEFCKWANIGLTSYYAEKKSGRLKVKKFGRRDLVTDDAGREWLANLPDAPASETEAA